MKIQIYFKILTFIMILFLYSCSSNQNKYKTIESSKSIDRSNDSGYMNFVEEPIKQLKEEDKYPKVLTYNDIFDKKDELNEDYEDSKKYSSNTLSLKKSLDQSFYDYLSTQFKYMLSSELRILRNEFFARKGYKFKSKDLQEYFDNFYWYNAKIDDVNKLELTPFEKDIIDTIKVYEEKNIDLDSEYLKKQLRKYFKDNLKHEYGVYIIEVPSILFRRNIGYLIKGMPQHNKRWFSGQFLRVELMDTLKNDNLLIGLFGQVMCPDQYCLYGGEIITCDSLLNYIDSHSIEFETYESSEDKNGNVYKFKAPNSISSTLTVLRIKCNGQIEEE